MKGAFMQVKQLIEQQYPGMQVVGSNYPVSPIKQAAAQAVSIAQMGGFAMVIFGDKVFDSLGVPPPQFYTQNVANNRFGAGVGLWFVGNLIQNQLVSTGAFEVYYDGSLVFSKLAAGRMPAVDELISSLEAQMTGRPSDSAAADVLTARQQRVMATAAA
eukprot:GHUV01015347.1.p1 GENE.GHUV01015347.1~~GHUV01015347.1.p1  ORF type:complete len:159 (+),score=53.23 GHUV01015347.1:337-813(+)